MIIGIDAGNSEVKICGSMGLIKFISDIGEGRMINLNQVHGEDDMVFEYAGMVGFAGSLARYESEFNGSIMGKSKNHVDTKTRILLGIHRYITMSNIEETTFDIIIGQPISSHIPHEKEAMKNMLLGEHKIKVNGVEKAFLIKRCNIVPECASSFWSNPQNGLVRIVDIGSGTVNYSTVLDGRYIDKDSNTLEFGMNTNKSNDLYALCRGIVTNTLKKWKREDSVFLVGGAARLIEPVMKQFYPNVKILYPIFNEQFQDPIFANAISFYKIGENVYE